MLFIGFCRKVSWLLNITIFMKRELAYPARINKYLAYNNFCTRREADALIKSGRVKINGRLAVLGDKVIEKDEVIIDKKIGNKKYFYFAVNKPVGIVSHSPQEGEKSITSTIKFPVKVFPVGRLDKDSHGLIIMTNDGRITGRMLSPDYYHEKEYIVRVDKKITPSFLTHMANCVTLEGGYTTRKCQVTKIDDTAFSIVLTEGKKHQIRRMCAKLDRQVLDLRRVRIINIKLRNLRSGTFRSIEGEELRAFLGSLEINKPR